MNKKGLSPVIATALLISLAFVLAALIFIWANSLLKEKTLKFDTSIEEACKDVNFQAEAYLNSINVMELHAINRGRVPIQSFDIKLKSSGSIESKGILSDVDALSDGETAVLNMSSTGITGGQDIVVTPILLGVRGNQNVPYYCESAEINMRTS